MYLSYYQPPLQGLQCFRFSNCPNMMHFHLLCLTVRSLKSLRHSGYLGERHLQHLDSDDFYCHADLV